MSNGPEQVGTAIGFDAGKTNIKAVAVDGAGRLLWRTSVPTRPSQTAADIKRILHDYERESGPAGCVGLCAPGLASKDHRSIVCLPGNVPQIEGLDWMDYLDRSSPLAVLNDAQAAAVGEAWTGAAKGYAHAVVLTLGTGVGGGMICDGKLLQGVNGRAGHFGHLSIDLDGERGLVGTPGSLEDYIGDRTVSQRSGGTFTTTRDLVAAFDAGGGDAATIWLRSVYALACGIVSILNAFDPQVVVIGGGIASAGGSLFEPLHHFLDDLEWRPAGEATPVVAAVLGDLAGAVGAAHFAAASIAGEA